MRSVFSQRSSCRGDPAPPRKGYHVPVRVDGRGRRARDLARELEVAVAAAQAAGEVLRNGFGRQHRIEHKGEADLVTEADEEAERKIKEILVEAFPDHGVLTEEGGE